MRLTNKGAAILLMLLGLISTKMLEGDATFLVFTCILGVILIFSKEDWINR